MVSKTFKWALIFCYFHWRGDRLRSCDYFDHRSTCLTIGGNVNLKKKNNHASCVKHLYGSHIGLLKHYQLFKLQESIDILLRRTTLAVLTSWSSVLISVFNRHQPLLHTLLKAKKWKGKLFWGEIVGSSCSLYTYYLWEATLLANCSPLFKPSFQTLVQGSRQMVANLSHTRKNLALKVFEFQYALWPVKKSSYCSIW